MTAPLDRARQLVDLATNESASPNEARNAALAAAKLIKAHGLLDASAPTTRVVVSTTVGVHTESIVDDLIRRGVGVRGRGNGWQPTTYQRDTTAEAEAQRSWEEAQRAKAAGDKGAPARKPSKRRGGP